MSYDPNDPWAAFDPEVANVLKRVFDHEFQPIQEHFTRATEQARRDAEDRAFAQDEKDNVQAFGRAVDTPVLYLRGQHERGDIADYLKGLRDAGLRNLRGELIVGSGHFAPDEAPAAVAASIRNFVDALRV